jgi:hypothetical protein
MADLSAVKLEPEAILERLLVKKGNVATPPVQIKWVGLPESSSTWEDWYVLLARFPSVTSYGQDGSSAGGHVTPDQLVA